MFDCTGAMKKIDILGKRNQDKMKQMADPDAVLEKKMPKKQMLDDERFYTDQNIGIAILKEFQDNDYKDIIANKDVVRFIIPTSRTTTSTLIIIIYSNFLKVKCFPWRNLSESIFPLFKLQSKHAITTFVWL